MNWNDKEEWRFQLLSFLEFLRSENWDCLPVFSSIFNRKIAWRKDWLNGQDDFYIEKSICGLGFVGEMGEVRIGLFIMNWCALNGWTIQQYHTPGLLSFAVFNVLGDRKHIYITSYHLQETQHNQKNVQMNSQCFLQQGESTFLQLDWDLQKCSGEKILEKEEFLDQTTVCQQCYL